MYYQYISDGWAGHKDGVYGTEDVTAQNYSYMWHHYAKDKTLSETGYQFIDLNNDGIDELLVSVVDISEDNYSDMVYDIYTYYNGSIVHLAASGERDAFFIGDNGEICERGSGGAFITGYDYYLIDDGSLKCSEIYLYDAYEDENQPYFYASNPDSSYYDSYGGIITSKMEHITKEKFDAGISAHTHQKLNLTLFSEYFSNNSDVSSKCGDNAYWSFDETTGTLTIRGSGDMYDYGDWAYDGQSPPWCATKSYASNIKSVIIEEGITEIGDMCFYGSAVSVVKLPESLTKIGMMAFHNCINLKEIIIPQNRISIGDRAFGTYGNSGDGVITDFIIYGYANSTARTYASKYNITFQFLNSNGDIDFDNTISVKML